MALVPITLAIAELFCSVVAAAEGPGHALELGSCARGSTSKRGATGAVESKQSRRKGDHLTGGQMKQAENADFQIVAHM